MQNMNGMPNHGTGIQGIIKGQMDLKMMKIKNSMTHNNCHQQAQMHCTQLSMKYPKFQFSANN